MRAPIPDDCKPQQAGDSPLPDWGFFMTSATLTIAQAADFLNCAPVTVRRMISRGELRAYRYGKTSRLIRIDSRDLDRIKRPVTRIADLVGAGEVA